MQYACGSPQYCQSRWRHYWAQVVVRAGTRCSCSCSAGSNYKLHNSLRNSAVTMQTCQLHRPTGLICVNVPVILHATSAMQSCSNAGTFVADHQLSSCHALTGAFFGNQLWFLDNTPRATGCFPLTDAS
eukprot:g16541.t1